jgi:hypothetical protein
LVSPLSLLVPPIALVLFVTESLACSCAGPMYSDEKERLLFEIFNSDVVFEGTVTNVKGNAVEFKVNRCVKGNCGASITVRDEHADTTCSTGLASTNSITQRYRVTAGKEKTTQTYSFIPCGGFIFRSKFASE